MNKYSKAYIMLKKRNLEAIVKKEKKIKEVSLEMISKTFKVAPTIAGAKEFENK